MTNTDQRRHFSELNAYYEMSERGYETFLWGSKHFGYYKPGAEQTERQAQDQLQDLVAEKLGLTADHRVMDGGSGQGVVATYLAAKFGCRVEGVDALASQIPKARARAEALGVSARATFQQADYSATPFADASFDGIYTTETLSHACDLPATMREFHRLLKPGGRLALFEYSLAPDDQFSRREKLMLDRIIKGSAMGALYGFRHGEFGTVLEDAGFHDCHEDNISENIAPSLARLRKYALLPYYLWAWPLGRQEQMPNAASAVEIMKMHHKGLVRYNIYTARK